MKEILLKTDKLSKSFSNGGSMQHVLKNIDLELYKGDFTVIMGASGAGKSTLLYALSAEGDGAQGGRVHTGQGVQQGGLASAAGPHDDGEVAFVQLQVDISQNVLHGSSV